MKIERQAAMMLIYLIQNRDRVVSKEELIDFLWNGDSVSPSSLPRCMNAVRSVLGDRRGNGRPIIETIYGRGYQFALPVKITDVPVSTSASMSLIRTSRLNRIEASRIRLVDSRALPREKAWQWLALADLETRHGFVEDARSSLLHAVVLARALEDFTLLGRAAIAMAETYIFAHHNDFLVSLLTEAIQGISETEFPLMLELRSQREIALLGQKSSADRRRDISQILRNVATIDDTGTHARVLLLSHRALDSPGMLRERRKLSDEALVLADKIQQPQLCIAALNARLNDAIGVGDLKEYELTCEHIQRLARSIDENLWLARAAMARALLAFLKGDYGQSTDFRDEALSLIEQSPEDHRLFMCIHGFMIGREQPENLLRAMPALGIEQSRDPVSEVSIALGSLYLGLGLGQASDSGYRPGSSDWIQTVDTRFDFIKLVAISLCAEVANLRNDVILAERLRDELSKFSESMIPMAAYVCLEPREYFLALAETTIGSWESAGQHFSYATTLCQKLEAPALEARISFAWATMLMRQSDSDQAPLARAKTLFAYETAKRLGMTRLKNDARTLLEQISSTTL